MLETCVQQRLSNVGSGHASQPCLGFVLREPSANSLPLKLEELRSSCEQHKQQRFGTDCVLRSVGRVWPDSSPELCELPVDGGTKCHNYIPVPQNR